MNGDNPGATLEDADSWIAVYSELVRSTETALRKAQSRGPTPEIQLLEVHLTSFRDRLAFWRIRRGRDELLARPAEASWLVSSPAVGSRPFGPADSAIQP
jgi:hypothetical protein